MAARQRYAATQHPAFPRFVADMLRTVLAKSQAPDENTCPLLEGLAAGLGLLRAAQYPDAGLITALEVRTKAELERNLHLQLQPEQQRIDFGGGVVLTAPTIASQTGAWLFGRYAPRIRVDMSGHCLSALVELGNVAPR